MSRASLFRHPGIRILERAARRERRQQVLAAVLLLLTGALMIRAFFDRSTILSVLGLGITVLGLRFFYRSLLELQSGESHLMYVLRHQPGRIVWVYSLVTERMPFGFQFSKAGTLYFKLLDGEEISINISAKKIKLVSKTLSRLLPHASFGYTVQREQWFLHDPEKLLRKRRDGSQQPPEDPMGFG